MTELIKSAEFRKLVEGGTRTRQPKFRNKAFWADGIYWHSKRERHRWLELKLLEKSGEISELRRQVAFPLHAGGVRIGTYRADHVYRTKSGQLIVEDVKAAKRAGQKMSATATPAYRRSKRHLKAEYGIDIMEY